MKVERLTLAHQEWEGYKKPATLVKQRAVINGEVVQLGQNI